MSAHQHEQAHLLYNFGRVRVSSVTMSSLFIVCRQLRRTASFTSLLDVC